MLNYRTYVETIIQKFQVCYLLIVVSVLRNSAYKKFELSYGGFDIFMAGFYLL